MGVSLDGVFLYDSFPVEVNLPEKRADLRQETDVVLARRARTGDYPAFEELVRRYRNDAFAMAYHFVRDREDAWDISQEAFIKAHGALGRFRGEASFKTWLLRIVANLCKDFFKKRRLPTVAFDETRRIEDAPSRALGPGRTLEAKELGAAIDAAVATLPDKHRMAFVLREYEGLSYEEMAQVIGCSLGTVMSRLHHARKKLQHSLIRIGMREKPNDD